MSETESNSDEVMSDGEWSTYTDRLDKLMLQTYKDVMKLLSDEDEVKEVLTTDDDDVNETQLKLAQIMMMLTKHNSK